MFKVEYERVGGLIEDPQITDRVGATWAAAGTTTFMGATVLVSGHLRAPHDNAQAMIDQLDQANIQLTANDQHAQEAMVAGSQKGLQQHIANMSRVATNTSKREEVARNQPDLPFGTGVAEGLAMTAIPVVILVAGVQRARQVIRGKQSRELIARRHSKTNAAKAN